MNDNIFDEIQNDPYNEIYETLFKFLNKNSYDSKEKAIWNKALMWVKTQKIYDMIFEDYIKITKEDGQYYIELTQKLYNKFNTRK